MSTGGPRRHVLAFGTERYTHEELPALPGVVEDLPAVIGSLAGLGYESAAVFPEGLLNPRGPDEVVRPMLRWLDEAFEDGDTLVIYFSGHGQEESGHHYLLCADSETGPAELRISALPVGRLVELPALKGVSRLLLVLDSCYAGRGAVDALEQAVRAKLAVADAPGADHRFLKAFGVLCAARILQEARDGVFSAALSTVLTDEARLGNRASHISLPELVRGLNAEFRRRGVEQRADWAQLCDDTVEGDLTTGFFPNPYYVPQLLVEGREFDLAEQRFFVRRLGLRTQSELAEQRRRDAELMDHFSPRGTGRQTVNEVGHYFTGRGRVLERLAGWLRGETERQVRVFVVTGPPGVGKSAVLGRLVALSDPRVRETIPADTVSAGARLPVGVVTVAVHARSLTLAQMTAALAAAVEAPEPTARSLRERLASLDTVATIVVDALDEAGSSQGEERQIAQFLGRLVADAPKLRLLIGVRPHIVGTVVTGVRQAEVINLADPAWTDPDDLVMYAEQLLRAPHGPGSDTGLPAEHINRIATHIAASSHPLFLVARLVARAVATRGAGDAPGPAELPAPVREHSPEAAVGRAFTWALELQLGREEAAHVRTLLLPLAYAEGQGMPLSQIWSVLASRRPSEAARTAERLLHLLRSDVVGPYVVEAVDDEGRSVYRLYHQSLADNLKKDAPDDVWARWYRRLLGTVPRTPDGRRLWRQADPYVLRHLPACAAGAGLLEELVGDAEFLVYAHPVGLTPLLRGLQSESARLAAAVYRAHLEQHRGLEPEERRHVLSCDAARHRYDAMVRNLNRGGRHQRWKPLWAAAGRPPAALSPQLVLEGLPAPVVAVCHAELEGRGVVLGAEGHKVRVWGAETGLPLGEFEYGEQERVSALACTTVDGHSTVAVGTEDGTVWLHDLVTHTVVAARGHRARVTGLVCTALQGDPVVVSADADGTLRTWDPAGGSSLPHTLTLGAGCSGALAGATVRGRPVVVAGDRLGALHVWDLTSGDSRSSDPTDSRTWKAMDHRPWDITYSRPSKAPRQRFAIRAVSCAVVHGQPVAVTADGAGVRLWALTTRGPMEISARLPAVQATGVACISLDEWAVAVIGARDGSVHLLDLALRETVATSWSATSGAVLAVHGFGTLGVATAVVGTEDGSVRVWDLALAPGGSWEGHSAPIRAVALSYYRSRPVVVTASEDTTLRVWDMATGAPAAPVVTDGISLFMALAAGRSHDRALALTSSANRPAEVWDLTTGTTMDHLAPCWATAVAVSTVQDRAVAVTADHLHRLRVRDLETGMALFGLPGHTARVTALCGTVVADRPVVVSAAEDRTVRLWSLVDQREESCLACLFPPVALACVSLGDRPAVLIAFEDGTVRIWDGHRDSVLLRHPGIITALACTVVDGRLVPATGGRDGAVAVWEPDHGEWPELPPQNPADVFSTPARSPVRGLEFGPGGRLVVCVDRDVYVFGRARDAAPDGDLPQVPGSGHELPPRPVSAQEPGHISPPPRTSGKRSVYRT
ncbi:caspase family protein [Streptomyces sp. NPDC058960]|uniref:nSTAND1 domain-containing NTPase n=1 Tax=Streptomyces sp. NPDC058960 TaxID=3346679 RepID=UPI0036BEDB27